MTENPEASSQAVTRVVGLLLAAVVAIVVVCALITNRNFWFDEAMVFQAIKEQPFLAPGQALAHYEQALPYGVYAIFKALVSLVGLNETILRIPVLLAYVGGVAALWWATRSLTGLFGRAAAVLAGGLGMWVVLEAAMFKAYIFEYAVAAVLLALGWNLIAARFSRASIWWFAAVSVVSLLFSTTAPLATGSVALAVLVIAAFRMRDSLRAQRMLLIVTAIGYVLVFAAYYLLVTKPSLVYQLSLPIYGATGLGSAVTALAGIFAPTGKPVFLAFGVAVGVTILVGAILARRWPLRSWYPFLALAVVVLVIAFGSVTRLAPFTASRQVLFAVPFIGLAFGAAAQAIRDAVLPLLRRSTVFRVVAVALVGVVAAGFIGIAVFGAVSKHEEVGRILAANAGDCPVTYTDYSFQPAAQMYVARDRLAIRLAGTVPTRSGLGHDGWFQRIRDDLPAYEQKAVNYFEPAGSACLLTGPDATSDELVPPLRDAGFTCQAVDRLTGVGLYRCER
ncbi:ArnT family glycosyltransferase [Leifsonia sp. LS-T14]|uniref:ArnT family glycosyltransferase n=1 Tax=unclassified Leifsonia TaxID=2663824 RepID=UPI0035A60E5A